MLHFPPLCDPDKLPKLSAHSCVPSTRYILYKLLLLLLWTWVPTLTLPLPCNMNLAKLPNVSGPPVPHPRHSDHKTTLAGLLRT